MSVLMINLDLNSKVPLYRQIYYCIRKKILQGEFQKNERLPSKRKLAVHLQVSQNTIETAYEQLMAEGYIYTIAKKGYYVAEVESLLHIEETKEELIAVTNKKTQKHPTISYHFATNAVELEYFPYQLWRKLTKETLQRKNKQLLNLGDPQGDELLRQAIGHYLYTSRGVKCLPRQIIIGAGIEYLLGVLVQILGQEKKFAVENPGYRKIYETLKGYGANVFSIPLDNEGIQIEKLRDSMADIIYITPSHQFPLGIVMPIKRRNQLLKWGKEKENRYIIEDDYDSEFRFVGKPIPALQGLDKANRVIYMSTFSKSIAPSIRISYMVLPMQLLGIYYEKFAHSASTVSRLEQHILYRFISEGYFERHLNKMRLLYKSRKEIVVEEINKLPFQVKITGEHTGLHLLMHIETDKKEEDLLKALTKHDVKIYGFSQYYMEKSNIEKEKIFLIGYANLTEEQIRKGINIIGKVWGPLLDNE